MGMRGRTTHSEIFQQPLLWPTTLARVVKKLSSYRIPDQPAVITGAGTSAYAATAIAAGWPGARAIPTTDLLLDARLFLRGNEVLVSVARSGDSPESGGVVAKVQQEFPNVQHVAICCHADGKLLKIPNVEPFLLDPGTNDKSLVMTSSFSNLVLAGLCLRHSAELGTLLPEICSSIESILSDLDASARRIAAMPVERVAILASPPLWGAAQETSLKILEMTAGKIVVLTETFLGLRHGPMSYLRDDTLVLCFLSADSNRRLYELDLLRELRTKKLGRIVVIGSRRNDDVPCADLIVISPDELRDEFRTPFDIVFPQLLAYHLSLGAGLDPDNPSPKARHYSRCARCPNP